MSTSTNGVLKAVQANKPRYVDIGINLTDPVYSGIYYDTQRHPADLPSVISRAITAGCEKLIVTGSDLEESRKAIELSKEHYGVLFATVGVHPCSCLQFTKAPNSPEIYLRELEGLALEAKDTNHCFLRGLKEEMEELVSLGFDIGVNGCSLKTEENLEVVKAIPMERLQIETDGPWCEIRPSHASSKWLKGFEEGKYGEGMSEGERSIEGGKGWKSVKKEKWLEGVMVKVEMNRV
ncbi:hypothetical protein DID88_001092 [Monilinia fructigena]|uniref:Uncharacterized protein n=1 Tax=Monilinia fructigena TaxID=38457 RepID=A0A395IZW7_9HELO|nr:hypothetical protein DID88_001092 [Monilinia fructigena]